MSLPFLNMSGSAAVAGRAVVEKEKSDIQGRDHASLGTTLHQVGCCFLNTGDFDAACRWFERAVEEKEKADVHGRVDHASLGASAHQMGNCLFNTGNFVAARLWYERALLRKRRRAIFTPD
jgi:tetratricopeptide (TPR) repeat protein